jgi:hypothetical protein
MPCPRLPTSNPGLQESQLRKIFLKVIRQLCLERRSAVSVEDEVTAIEEPHEETIEIVHEKASWLRPRPIFVDLIFVCYVVVFDSSAGGSCSDSPLSDFFVLN